MKHKGSVLLDFWGEADSYILAHAEAIKKANEDLQKHTDSVVQAMFEHTIETTDGVVFVGITLAVSVPDKSETEGDHGLGI